MVLQLFIDCLVATESLCLLVAYKSNSFSIQYQILAIITILLIFITYHHSGQYRQNKPLLFLIFSRFKAWSTVIFILLVIGFITKSLSYYSREVFIWWIAIVFIVQNLFQILIKSLYLRIRNKYYQKKHALILGSSPLAKKLALSINKHAWLGQEVIGYVDKTKSKDFADFTFLGSLDQISDIITKNKINHVYITLPSQRLDELELTCLKLMKEGVDLHWTPDTSSFNLINHHIKEIAGLPIITFSESPLVGGKRVFKRVFDFTFSLIAMICLLPILLLVALLIKLDSSGPVFFRQERHGWDREVFNIYKFRSMKQHQEKKGLVTQAIQGDPRITKLGAFLRKTSIDELPQLINVLIGDMSIVGPRPHAIAHNEYFQHKINGYLSRHKIKPGITGLAQITGYRGETDTDEKMLGRIKQDLTYINNWSLELDIEIILKTMIALWLEEAY